MINERNRNIEMHGLFESYMVAYCQETEAKAQMDNIEEEIRTLLPFKAGDHIASGRVFRYSGIISEIHLIVKSRGIYITYLRDEEDTTGRSSKGILFAKLDSPDLDSIEVNRNSDESAEDNADEMKFHEKSREK